METFFYPKIKRWWNSECSQCCLKRRPRSKWNLRLCHHTRHCEWARALDGLFPLCACRRRLQGFGHWLWKLGGCVFMQWMGCLWLSEIFISLDKSSDKKWNCCKLSNAILLYVMRLRNFWSLVVFANIAGFDLSFAYYLCRSQQQKMCLKVRVFQWMTGWIFPVAPTATTMCQIHATNHE